MKPITLYIPRDTAAVAAGVEKLIPLIQDLAQAQQQPIHIVRNGTHGLLWLEPLIEVQTPSGRVAYGPVTANDLPSLFQANWLQGGEHPLCHGLTTEIPYLKNQERLTFSRIGHIDPLSLDDYASHGGWQGLQQALLLDSDDLVDQMIESGLRGRGGAAFPTGIKWKTVLKAQAPQKYIVCNADEGDSGTYSDRILMEADPYSLIEGMIIAGLAVGATRGYIYLRSEYPLAYAILQTAIQNAYQANYLGANIQGSTHHFDLEVRLGAGAYICGEETSLLESLEGKRGVIRFKPPLPALKGFLGQPTVVNNVVTLASVPIIYAKGASYYQQYGMGRSRGTLAFQLTGNLKRGGLVEKAFGVTLRELLFDFGGGSASGNALRAVQVGGPLGAYLPESQWDIPLDYESYAAVSAMVGHGGIVAFDQTVDMAAMAEYAMEFCAVESCGKCTPCRIGSTRGVETIAKIRRQQDTEANLELLHDLCDTLQSASLCALGSMTPYPVLSALEHFSEDFGLHPKTNTSAIV